jgi:hypothetical protein
MRSIAASLLVLILLAVSSPALAAWSESGILVDDQMGSRGAQWVRMQRSEDGDLFLLIAGFGNAMGYEVQRILASGALPAGWDVNGVYFQSGPLVYHTQALAPDGAGGAFHVGYFDSSTPDSVGLQHVRADGVLEPTGGSQYWRLSRAASSHVDAASDGAGGVYVTWSYTTLRLQRRAADGSVSPGWSPFGRYLAAGGYGCPDVESDGAGGAILFWTYPNPRAIRILPDTTTAPGWPAGGLVLSPNQSEYFGLFVDLPKLLPSGPEHWIAVWLEMPDTGVYRVVAQRFGLDGTLDPAWPAAGFEVVPLATGITGTTAISDGLGGLHMLWGSNNAPRWTHVLASGAFAPGHNAAGRNPLDAAAAFPGVGKYLVGAAAPGGGLIFLWDDTRASQRGIHARWLLSDGSPNPSEPDAGRLIPLTTTNGVKAALPDGLGGVFVAWQSWVDDFHNQLYVGRLLPTILVGVPPGPARPATGLALRVPNPNPARDGFDVSFVLPDDAPARLELFDVSGRLLRALEVRGAGAGSARFDRAQELSAGLYLVRLTRGSESRTARVAIVP